MSTFDGQLREYPSIAVDRFTPRANVRYYFLTHVHADHTQGLDAPQFLHKVHCSDTTADILLRLKDKSKSSRNKFEHLRGCLQTSPLLEPFVLDTLEYGKVNVTYLPANHCPGAVMILIEGCHGNILYTGDVRAEPDFVDEIASILEGKTIDHLYMDTTHCDPQTREFITKDRSIDALVETIESLPDNHHIYLDFWTFGFEELWIAVAEKYNTKIHVSPERYKLYSALNPIYAQIFSTIADESRFHSCQWRNDCRRHSYRTTTIHPVPVTGDHVRALDPVSHILRTDFPKSCPVPNRITLPYSFHSSFAEIVDFCKAIKPKRFTPIVAHGKKWTTAEYMLSHIRSHGAMLDASTEDCSSSKAISNESSSSTDCNSSDRMSIASSVTKGSLSDNKEFEENFIALSKEKKEIAVDNKDMQGKTLSKYELFAQRWRERHLERRRKRNTDSMLSSSSESGTWTWPEDEDIYPKLSPDRLKPLKERTDNLKDESSSDKQQKVPQMNADERKPKRPRLADSTVPGSSIENAIYID